MSAVREAVEAAMRSTIAAGALDNEGEVAAAIIRAVEGVPVQVTIRELDMADPANIVTVADPGNVSYIHARVLEASMDVEPLHLTVDGSYLKLKVGHGSWSAPIETEVYEG